MKRFLISAAVMLALMCPLGSQDFKTADFQGAVSILDSMLTERTGVVSQLTLKKVTPRKGALDFHFNDKIAFRPIRPGDYAWIRDVLGGNLPEKYSGYSVGRILLDGRPISALSVPAIGNDGRSIPGIKIQNRKNTPLTDRGIDAPKGLYGRHIVLWQSHGRYYDNEEQIWKWQRPPMFRTIEDIFTLSFVVPFLTPMLENAGANVLLPRERDFRTEEIIIDNDKCESGSARIHGTVIRSAGWTEASAGFADTRDIYHDGQDPFEMGSFLWRKCNKSGKENRVTWAADVPSRGEYAVYVAYRTLPESTQKAHYIIHSMGCDVDVFVDQTKGGGGWLYLGTYEFDKGAHPLVSLSDISPKGGVVVADAVRIGGGFGNIARGPEGADTLLSGMPRFAEGARYYMQWNGVPKKVWSQNDGTHDYRDDLMSRGKWVEYLAGGSWANPSGKGLGIPIDLSLAFHTDAGTTPDENIIGTLSIYTLKCDGKSVLDNGESRTTCRELSDLVQTQLTDDIRSLWNKDWQRRELYNRSYSESRTTGVPAVLLELLSHQNFEDMKYGLDPLFKFSVARSCYKAILKYLSLRYNVPYTVQPLPVSHFSVRLDDTPSPEGKRFTTLSWKETVDTLEPTATAKAFKVFTRIDDGGWDNGVNVMPRDIDGTYSISLPVEEGHIYSYKVTALNDGGYSFPSEVLAVGLPFENKGRILIVNNFNRISGPVWFDSPTWAGFDSDVDCGVPYIRDWSIAGRQFEFDRNKPFIDNVQCGFGQNTEEYAGKMTAGNSFDYPYIHGLSAFKAGYAFDSCSSASFCKDASLWMRDAEDSLRYFAVDLICGKECRVRTGFGSATRGGIFPEGMKEALLLCTGMGCNVMISGSYIAHDVFSAVYPTEAVKGGNPDGKFALEVLGYGLHRAFGSKTGRVTGLCEASFPTNPCTYSYCVESPDALSSTGEVTMTYIDTGYPAAVRTDFDSYRTAAFGFPLEIVDCGEARDVIFRQTLEYFRQRPAREQSPRIPTR